MPSDPVGNRSLIMTYRILLALIVQWLLIAGCAGSQAASSSRHTKNIQLQSGRDIGSLSYHSYQELITRLDREFKGKGAEDSAYQARKNLIPAGGVLIYKLASEGGTGEVTSLFIKIDENRTRICKELKKNTDSENLLSPDVNYKPWSSAPGAGAEVNELEQIDFGGRFSKDPKGEKYLKAECEIDAKIENDFQVYLRDYDDRIITKYRVYINKPIR
jgi:hypothetical protein